MKRPVELPVPRLELRWRDLTDAERAASEDYEWSQRECRYLLVLPLREHDLRRENSDGEQVRDTLEIEMASRTMQSGPPPLFGRKVDTPFRNGAHAKWDSAALGGLPIWATYNGDATEVQL